MITSFEVGAVFKIINEASPALLKMLRQVRELNEMISKTRENIALIGKPAAMGTAIAETGDLAKVWADVAKNAGAARLAISQAAATAVRSAPAATAAGGGGGRHRPRWLGGGGAHINGPGAGIPGSGHVRFGGGAMAAAGLVGYGAYEAAQMEDAVFQMIYHSGGEQNDANRRSFRKVLQDAMAESGYGLHDISEAAKQELRMFQGTKGGGLDVLPEMLRAATIESRLKGESPEESMRALIGLAHMTKQYSPEAIKKLAPAFAFLSTANPSSLSSIERAAGYAVPLLQSGLEIDPIQSLLMGTALTRAGATNTKSGTWLREMALRAMPGTSMMSKMAFRKHEEALKAFGLVDDKDKPTWFTDGKPDLFKMLDIAGGRAAGIPVEKRAAYERALFGAQGGGGFALLSDPAVREQVNSLRATMDSPDFKNRYSGFMGAYREGSTVQNARTAFQEFNNTLMDIGQNVLPGVNKMLGEFKGVLEKIRGVLPGSEKSKDAAMATVVDRALWGAGAGAVYGAFGGPGGVALGALGGGVLGVAEGYMEQNNKAWNLGFDKGGSYTSPGKTGKPAVEKIDIKPAPLTLSINLDGQLLAQTMTQMMLGPYSFPTQAPTFDGSGSWVDGDHQHSDN
jgi:hypothetical protein